MAGHNLRKTYPPPPHSVLWISLWSTLELPIWYIVCFLYIMFLPFDICKKDVSILIRQSVQDKMIRRTTKMLAAMPDMTIIILTIVAMSRNFTTILTNDKIRGSHCDWDWAAQEASPEREPWWDESCFGTWVHNNCHYISLVEIVISSVSRISIVNIIITMVIEPWCGEGCFCTWE